MTLELSSKTQANKKFRLPELYKMLGADKVIRDDGKVILSAELSNVLNRDRLNLSTSGKVEEIYIFKLTLEEKRIPSTFIAALDKFTNFHTVFVLQCGDESALYAALKERTEKGFKIGKYYSTEWARAEKRISLPMGIATLDDAYTFLIDLLIPIDARTGENTAELVARYEQIIKLQKEIDKLQRQVDAERQPKRRFELNDKLKELKRELEKLVDSD